MGFFGISVPSEPFLAKHAMDEDMGMGSRGLIAGGLNSGLYYRALLCKPTWIFWEFHFLCLNHNLLFMFSTGQLQNLTTLNLNKNKLGSLPGRYVLTVHGQLVFHTQLALNLTVHPQLEIVSR